MSTPTYGEVSFSIEGLSIATLNSDGTYGTPVSLVYGQTFGFTSEADTDQLKAFGMIVETLTVPTHFTGTFTQGAIDIDAYEIMCGLTADVSGSSPSGQTDLSFTAGGSGLPYFGMIGRLAGVQGAGVLVGFPKMMLDSYPSFEVEQNRFIMPETSARAIVQDTTSRMAAKVRMLETAQEIPTDFDTFFGS